MTHFTCRLTAKNLDQRRNLTLGNRALATLSWLPLQPLRGLLPVSLLGEQRHDGWEQFAKTAAAILTQALLRLSPER